MKDTTVAARYARALFMTTEKRTETAQALEDLKGMRQVLEPGARVRVFLATPHLRLQDKREALKTGLKGHVLPIVAVFLDLLLRKKRLGEFETIASEFQALVERAQGIQRAHVVSAVPLQDAETQTLQKTLESYTKKTIRLTAEVDPALLGGALVRIGDRVVDRTVKSLLEAIEQQLSEVSV